MAKTYRAQGRRTVSSPETALCRAILDALRDCCPDATFARLHAGRVKVRGGWMHAAPEGWADIVGCVTGSNCHVDVGSQGRFCALEVKLPGERPSTVQSEYAARVRELGGFYAVARSVDDALAAVERCRQGASE